MTVTHKEVERIVKEQVRVVFCDQCGKQHTGEVSGYYLPVGWFSITTRNKRDQKRADACSVKCFLMWGAMQRDVES